MSQIEHHCHPDQEKARESEIADHTKAEAEIARQLEEDRLKLGEKEIYARGGIKIADRRMIAFQRKAFIAFIKSLGMKLINRQDLSRISMPVKLFEPRSYLQRITDSQVHISTIFNPLAESDPLEQMKGVVTFSISGLIQTVSNWKPFNPILGETFQCTLEDGTFMQLEQTSHHPPISHWIVEAPNNEQVFTGHAEWQSSQKGNAAKGTQGGINRIQFLNGTTIVYTNPEFQLSGILWGDRVAEYKGFVTFIDENNSIETRLEYDPDRLSYLKSFFVNAKSPSDSFHGDLTKNGVKISDFSGSWLTHVLFDGEKYFDIKSFKYPKIINFPDALPSDSRFRSDLVALREGNYEKSQRCKINLEEKQRRDRSLRAQAKSSNFSKSKSENNLSNSKSSSKNSNSHFSNGQSTSPSFSVVSSSPSASINGGKFNIGKDSQSSSDDKSKKIDQKCLS